MTGSTCKKNARGFRNPRPGKGLRSEKKISCRYALSSRRQGQRPCTPSVAASVRRRLGGPPPRGVHRRLPFGKAAPREKRHIKRMGTNLHEKQIRKPQVPAGQGLATASFFFRAKNCH